MTRALAGVAVLVLLAGCGAPTRLGPAAAPSQAAWDACHAKVQTALAPAPPSDYAIVTPVPAPGLPAVGLMVLFSGLQALAVPDPVERETYAYNALMRECLDALPRPAPVVPQLQ